MSEWHGIEELYLPAARSGRSIPKVSLRLLETIRLHGPIEPVVARKIAARRYEILSNAETWLAAQRLGRDRVPVEVLPGIDDEDAAEIVEACFQDDKEDPLTEAQLLAERLEKLGGRSRRGAVRRLAAATGLSRSYISHALRLLKLPPQVQDLLRNGEISVGHAKLLVTINDEGRQLRFARQIARERLSVRQTEQLAKSVKSGVAISLDPRPEQGDPDVARFERMLTNALGSLTYLDTRRGRLVIEYGRDLDVLDGVLQRLGIEDF